MKIHYLPMSKVRGLFKLWHPNQNFTIEHIVPKSLMCNKTYSRDMHNILWLPSKVNNHRDNYKWVSDLEINTHCIPIDYYGNIINKLLFANETDFCHVKSNMRREFMPLELYRGRIARSCMYFLDTYPENKDIILEKVIDLDTICKWHERYPVTIFEKKKNINIAYYQGIYNKYIENEVLLFKDLYNKY